MCAAIIFFSILTDYTLGLVVRREVNAPLRSLIVSFIFFAFSFLLTVWLFLFFSILLFLIIFLWYWIKCIKTYSNMYQYVSFFYIVNGTRRETRLLAFTFSNFICMPRKKTHSKIHMHIVFLLNALLQHVPYLFSQDGRRHRFSVLFFVINVWYIVPSFWSFKSIWILKYLNRTVAIAMPIFIFVLKVDCYSRNFTFAY